jgi:hypothetical protein
MRRVQEFRVAQPAHGALAPVSSYHSLPERLLVDALADQRRGVSTPDRGLRVLGTLLR